jgi:hypothetical protein
MRGGKLATHCQAGGVSLEESGHRSTISQSRVSRLEFRVRLKPETQTPDPRLTLAATGEACSSGVKLVNNPG